MNKSIILEREDFAKGLIDLINGAHLPAFVKVEVMNGFVRTLEQLAVEEYQREKQAWEKQNKEADESDGNESE